jgi:hypothetical protein
MHEYPMDELERDIIFYHYITYYLSARLCTSPAFDNIDDKQTQYSQCE